MKQQQCKTSSIIIDIENSSFKKMNEAFSVYEFKLPSFIKDKFNEYAILHNWAKDNLNLPYYLNTPSKRIYVLVPTKEQAPELTFEDNKLSSLQFADFNTKEKFHITIKLLLAKYFELSENFVSNDKFFLHADVNRANSWATVLKIDLTHNYKNKNELEFSVKDAANRLKKISLEAYNKYFLKKIVYGKSIKGGQLFFKQLKRSEIRKFECELFAESNFNNSNGGKTKIDFHSIDSLKHESSKSFLLERFSGNFLTFLNDYGIKASAKVLNLEKIEIKNNKAILDIKNFNVSLIDGRKVKKLSLTEIFQNSDAITFTEKTIADLMDNDTCLFVMDYNKEDFEERFKGEIDPYKTFKESLKHVNIAKQGICINENYFDEDARDAEQNKEEYLNYEGLRKEDLERNLSICISQLYLKNILLNNNVSLLPHSETLNNHCFAFRNYLLFTEDNKLIIEEFESAQELLNRIGSKFSKLNVEDIFQKIYSYHNPYPTNKEFDFLTHKFIFSNEGVIEIIDIPERAFYDEAEIKQRIAERNKKRIKTEFKSKNDDPISQQFNDLIDETVEDLFISYEELKAKYGKGETGFLSQIFGAKNESPLLKFLNINSDLQLKGLKQNGIFSTYTGIWFDKQHKQYFVGRTHGYQQRQEKGSQMKKIVTHFGTFDEQTFFNLLNVDFIRYKELTVHPFPFKLIEMFQTIKLDTQVKSDN
ncbi:MAG: hypothetical protein K2Q03_04155 [Sphingobacteriaceae bacterium]|nr:hypothetical protein [Sphingobacteriaceae bacterium]